MPKKMWPRVIVRWSDEKDLWVSGMLAGGSELAGTPAVIDVPPGKGVACDPLRQQPNVEARDARELHALAQQALHHDHLHVGRDQPAADKQIVGQ